MPGEKDSSPPPPFSLPPLASERPVASRRGMTVGQAMNRVVSLANSARAERDAARAEALLEDARRLASEVRGTFEANPSNARESLAPLVATTRDALDAMDAELADVAVHVGELHRRG